MALSPRCSRPAGPPRPRARRGPPAPAPPKGAGPPPFSPPPPTPPPLSRRELHAGPARHVGHRRRPERPQVAADQQVDALGGGHPRGLARPSPRPPPKGGP